PLEYVGDPLEKLLGFLIAVVILAFYIGVVNLLLMFASFTLFHGNTYAYFVSFIGVIPIWFYAQYRARRYVLARTRWRGMRFGLAPGAWGYAFRALWHWLLTIVTAGLLWPRMTFKLEQYKTDRTYFGDARMVQGGRWTMLFPSLKWMLIAAGLAAIGVGLIASDNNIAAGAGLCVIAGFLGLFGLVYYRVDTLRRLTAHKTLNGVSLSLQASPFRVLMIHVFGYTLAGIAILIPLSLLGLVFASIQFVEELGEMGLNLPEGMQALDRWIVLGIGAALYFSIFLIWSALTHALITMPVIRHYAQGLTLTGTDALDSVRQRPRDEHTEAEGFAEALDVGASI
nr:DUF898 family protein [Paracoccaceae bacterium]